MALSKLHLCAKVREAWTDFGSVGVGRRCYCYSVGVGRRLSPGRPPPGPDPAYYVSIYVNVRQYGIVPKMEIFEHLRRLERRGEMARVPTYTSSEVS